eukprot:TRINITY_DN113079_c0_g1_i1.p1 TRINITY_DN113079_c0_g1~~TRINITY_DN113079_c0_g1_i1.p1  ORF type:complete len:513 (-),score=78.93 TRINITY_DN113079_c0_g1_i1:216-1754(-)
MASPCRVVLLWLLAFTGCEAGWLEGCDECETGCCCMFCGSAGLSGPDFACQSAAKCAAIGGQCKSNSTSAFRRPARAGAAQLPTASEGPEQLHLVGGFPDEVALVWVMRKSGRGYLEVKDASGVITEYFSSRQVYSFQNNPGGHDGVHANVPNAPGGGLCGPDQYTNSSCYYTSGVIHTVKLSGLKPGATYSYRVHGGDATWRHFRLPPQLGQPVTFGVVADLGQTADAAETLKYMKAHRDANEMDQIIFPGDLAYADGYAPAWDTFGRLSEPLLSDVPGAFGGGNHEVSASMESWANFWPRYGWPSSDRSNSETFMWFSYDTGLAHVIMLCSYCDASRESLQYAWLEQDLKAVNRSITPWVVVAAHVPWYSTNYHHDMSEAAFMRNAMEDLIYAAKVDVVFSGHVHGYERFEPVYKNESRCDGPVYIVVGDGGNHEGPACPWAANPPAWSARREFSFGFGLLSLTDPHAGSWRWHRNADNLSQSADEIALRRSALRCNSAKVQPTADDIVI